MMFRTKFYTEKSISAFRREMLEREIWPTDVHPYRMIKAMIIRLGDLSQPVTSYEVVDDKVRSFLDFLGYREYDRVNKELQLCKKLEKEIGVLIQEAYIRH